MYSRLFFLMFITLALLISGSCSLKKNTLKPITDQTNLDNNIHFSTTSQSALDNRELFRISDELSAHENRMGDISSSLSDYHVSYGKFPNTLDELVNSYMLIWPGCIYTGKPIKSINRMPDPSNSDDVGKIYYERISDHKSNTYFLALNSDDYKSGKIEWSIVKHEAFINAYDISPQGDKIDSTGFIGMDPEKRKWRGYSVYITNYLRSLLQGVLGENQYIKEETIFDILSNHNYYIISNGIPILKQAISSGCIKFDVGKIDNGMYIYRCSIHGIFDDSWCDDIATPLCFKGESEYDERIEDELIYITEVDDCTALMSTAISLINSDNFNEDAIPPKIIINTDDILN